MTKNAPTTAPCTLTDRDGLAVIGPSLAALRGHRFIDGPGGDEPTEPKEADPTDPKDPDPQEEPEPKDEDPFDATKAREKIRKANAENAALRKRTKEAEDKATAAGDAGEKVTALEADNLRLRVALKHGLPESLAKRLSGTTEEELLADAEELLGLFGDKKPPTQQPRERLRPGGDAPTDTDPTSDVDKFAEDVFRK